jgi:hypothetical protein
MSFGGADVKVPPTPSRLQDDSELSDLRALVQSVRSGRKKDGDGCSSQDQSDAGVSSNSLVFLPNEDSRMSSASAPLPPQDEFEDASISTSEMAKFHGSNGSLSAAAADRLAATEQELRHEPEDHNGRLPLVATNSAADALPDRSLHRGLFFEIDDVSKLSEEKRLNLLLKAARKLCGDDLHRILPKFFEALQRLSPGLFFPKKIYGRSCV